jgi:hypothetical protein
VQVSLAGYIGLALLVHHVEIGHLNANWDVPGRDR